MHQKHCLIIPMILLFNQTTLAHIVPDGHIERAVQVVVHDRRIEIEFRISISEKTQQQIFSDNSHANENTKTAKEYFCKWISKKITEHTFVTANGQKLKLVLVKVVPNARRHVDYAVFVETNLPNDCEKMQLQVHSRALIEFPGNWRGAIKTKGSAMVGKTDAAPILIRAQPIELVDLDKSERNEKESISATILIPN